MLRIICVVTVLGWNLLGLRSLVALDRPKDPAQAIPAHDPRARLSVCATVALGEVEARERHSAAMISPPHRGALGQQADRAPMDPGVYVKADGDYLYVEPEALTWRLESFSESGETTKAHVTARAAGPRSGLQISAPADFLIVFPKGVSGSRFQLLMAGVKEDRRDFTLELAWREEAFLGWSGKKNKTVAFDIEELPGGTFKVRIPSLPKGEYAFLLGSFLSKAALPAEKIYAFRSPPDSQAQRQGAAVAKVGAFPDKPGVYAEAPNGYIEIKPEPFDWYPASPWLRSFAKYGREYDRFVNWERMNGTLPSKETELIVSQGARFAIFCAEGTDAADYRLVRVESTPHERRLRLDALFVNYDAYLGFGQLPLSPGPQPIAFEAQKLGVRKYTIILPKLKRGHYGFLGPGMAELGQTGGIHAFEIR